MFNISPCYIFFNFTFLLLNINVSERIINYMRLIIIMLLCLSGCTTNRVSQQIILPPIFGGDATILLYEFADKVQTINFNNWSQFDLLADQYMHNLKSFESDEVTAMINRCHHFVRAFSQYGQANGYYPNVMIRSKLRLQIVANATAQDL